MGLREGLACEVRLGGEVVVTGYIDDYEPDLTETTSTICVEGRSRTGDLVDCSAPAIVGGHLRDRSRKPLVRLAKSASLWERRIAVVAT